MTHILDLTMLSSSLIRHANQDFPTRSRRTKSTTKSLIPSAVANPISHEPLRRTGSFAAATITAALAIWVTTSSNGLQSLLLSLSYVIHRTLWSSRWSTVHRKQLYQRSLAHPALHAPSLSPPRAPLSPSRRPRTTRHPPPSATRNLMILNEIRQQVWLHREFNRKTPIMLLGRNSSSNKHCRARDTKSLSEDRRRRRRRQNSSRYRRRRRQGCRFRHPATTDRRRRKAVSQRTSAVIAASPHSLPLPRRCRHHRRLSRWSWLPRRSRRTTDPPRAPPRNFASWSVVIKTKSPLSLTAPLEDRGSRGR